MQDPCWKLTETLGMLSYWSRLGCSVQGSSAPWSRRCSYGAFWAELCSVTKLCLSRSLWILQQDEDPGMANNTAVDRSEAAVRALIQIQILLVAYTVRQTRYMNKTKITNQV